MEVVVTIPDGYAKMKEIKNGSIAAGVVLKAVKEGIVLPKEHGDLVDADSLNGELDANGSDGYVRKVTVLVPASREIGADIEVKI